MKVRRVPQIVQIKVCMVQVKSRARIGQNLTFLGKRKNHSHAGSLATEAFYPRNVNVAFRQALHAKLAERIASDARSESNATTKERNIVRKDCRNTADGKRKIAGHEPSLG